MADTTIDGLGTQMDFVQNLADFCNNSITDFFDELSVASSFAYALCGLFALFYVANIVWKSWVNGGQIDLYRCIKPFVIGFLIINFSWVAACVDFVVSGFDSCSKSFVAYEQEKAQASNAQVYEAIKTMNAKMLVPGDEVENEKENDEVKGSETTTTTTDVSSTAKDDDSWSLTAIKNWLEDHFSTNAIFLSLQAISREFICWLSSVIASLASCCIIMLSFVNRCILVFFGPFLFALSLLPSSDNMIMSWIRKYLTYSLYPVILNIINGIMTGAMCMVISGIASNTSPDHFYTGDNATLYYINIALAGVSICAIFMYMSVPSIAGQLIEVGSNAMGMMLAGAGSFAISKGGKALMNSDNKVTQQVVKAGGKAMGTVGKTAATGGANLAWDGAVAVGKGLWDVGKKAMNGTKSASSGGRREAGTSGNNKSNDNKSDNKA